MSIRELARNRHRTPSLRLRVGDWRVLYRSLMPEEAPGGSREPGLLIARVVNRRDLLRAVSTLGA